MSNLNKYLIYYFYSTEDGAQEWLAEVTAYSAEDAMLQYAHLSSRFPRIKTIIVNTNEPLVTKIIPSELVFNGGYDNALEELRRIGFVRIDSCKETNGGDSFRDCVLREGLH